MKLLTKASRTYFLVSLVIFLAASFVFYFIIRSVIYREIEDRLLLEKYDFELFVQKWKHWSDENFFVENKIQVVPLQVNEINKRIVFKDTLMYESFEGEAMPFRQLTFQAFIDGKPHMVSIRKSMLEPITIIEVVTGTMMSFLAILLVCLFFIHRRLSKTLWLPFYESLARIKAFDWTRQAGKEEEVTFPAGEIQEFNELNLALTRMTTQIRHDYRSLREFTENASHEIQTPLALITARVEQMIQSENLSGEQLHWIQEIYHSSRRISRLLESLLLLSRIENKQFTDVGEEDLAAFLELKLEDFSDVLKHKQIRVEKKLDQPFRLSISHALQDILFSNLLKNAIRHNLPDGLISISSENGVLEISNTGPDLAVRPEVLFERFRKESGDKESLGLGLSIVRQICDCYDLRVSYLYEKPFHKIIIMQAIQAPAAPEEHTPFQV
jgi:signal transduction histidine kinase